MKKQPITKPVYIFCPVCGRGKIFMENKEAKDIPLDLVLPDSKKKARWHIKCSVCKSQIGITVNR